MWINNSIIEKIISSQDEIPYGFIKGRLKKPKKIDILILKISKEDLIKYYIIENHSFIETFEYFNLECRGDLNKLLKFYNIKKDPKQRIKNSTYKRSHEEYIINGKKSAETQRKNWENKSEEEKLAWKKKQEETHSSQEYKKKLSDLNKEYNKNLDPDIKKERNIRRSISCKKSWSNPDLIAKQKKTAQINRQKYNQSDHVCRTYQEQLIFNKLKESYSDVEYDIYVDDRYPYYCDFYIKSLDLFIEYQGHPSHGSYPYIENDIKSINEANKLYGAWRDIYINRDYQKYKKAIESNINFIRIYPDSSLKENLLFNNGFNDIIELIYNTIK